MPASDNRPTRSRRAVALHYGPDDAAPVVVASGMGYLAEKIVDVAQSHGVPVYEDDSLATILTQLNLGQEIPPELYQAIVEIYVYFLNFDPARRETMQAAERPAEVTTAPEAASEPMSEPEKATELPLQEYREELSPSPASAAPPSPAPGASAASPQERNPTAPPSSARQPAAPPAGTVVRDAVENAYTLPRF